MKKTTFVIIPHHYSANQTTQISLPNWLVRMGGGLLFIAGCFLSYIILDYVNLRKLARIHDRVISENNQLRGEAEILMTHLDEVKSSLNRVNHYTRKLNDIILLKNHKVRKHTGIGPLSKEEYHLHRAKSDSTEKLNRKLKVPFGIDFNKLTFKPVLKELIGIKKVSHNRQLELQQLLAGLSKSQSLLSSVPSFAPVNGWTTSEFGTRTSPFTGRRSQHKGIDIAAAVGSPILAPADGVVIFSGRKNGFGKFIMIAHYGSGIVTRYGHNAENLVEVGAKVRRGDQIATVGMSGRTTGPHLHYEVWVNGKATNPKKFILNQDLHIF